MILAELDDTVTGTAKKVKKCIVMCNCNHITSNMVRRQSSRSYLGSNIAKNSRKLQVQSNGIGTTKSLCGCFFKCSCMVSDPCHGAVRFIPRLCQKRVIRACPLIEQKTDRQARQKPSICKNDNSKNTFQVIFCNVLSLLCIAK